MDDKNKVSFEPPGLAKRFLTAFCKASLLEEISGDLYEFYQIQRRDKSAFSANLLYWFHAIHFLRPFAMRTMAISKNPAIMIQNYLKVAVRNLQRNRAYSLLNIFGLAVGLSCCLFIAVYVIDEFSFDRHHSGCENIYRVVTDLRFGNRVIHKPQAPNLLAKYVRANIPGVKHTARFQGAGFTTVINVGETQFRQENVTFAHTDLFKVFDIPFLEGAAETVLDAPKTVVISNSTAKKLFGSSNQAIGKEIEFNRDQFLINGVIEDMPENSHFKFDLIMSIGYQDTRSESQWTDIHAYTYLKLSERADPKIVESQLCAVLEEFMAPQIKEAYGFVIGSYGDGSNYGQLYLQPLTSIHLGSNFANEIRQNGNIKHVKTLLLVGFLILLIASINFINLSTARAVRRAKEVGLRKVIGGRRSQLIQQFLLESFLQTFMAMLLAIGSLYSGLAAFNALSGKNLINPLFDSHQVWPYLLLAFSLISFLSGVYPALVLSSYQPIKVLKSNRIHGKSGNLRNALIILQFSASILVIVGAIVIDRQLNFIKQKDFGFARDELITLSIMDLSLYGANQEILEKDLLAHPRIQSLTMTQYVPVGGRRSSAFFKIANDGLLDDEMDMQYWPIDDQYISTMGMEIVAGRNFKSASKTDSAGVIINQTALNKFGFENPIGQQIKQIGKDQVYNIIGVVKDFHFASLKNKIDPLVMRLDLDPWFVTLRHATDANPQQVIRHIEDVWSAHAGGQPFVYSFVSDKYYQIYSNEDKMGSVILLLAGVATFIALLGLFGLAAFMGERRKKELAIRKVLGAKSIQLTVLLLINFLRLVILSSIIALPLSFALAQNWLDNFAYRTPLPLSIFISVFLSVLFISAITIIFQSARVGFQNPTLEMKSDG